LCSKQPASLFFPMFKYSYRHHYHHLGLLSQVVDTRLANLSAWKLKLSVTKPTSTAFNLNKETKRQLAVNVRGNTLPYNSNPTYLGVKLDRQLTRGPMPENPCTQQYPALPCWLVMGCQNTHHSYVSSCIRL